ncbi:unnamed protein product, partial [marine sediment metagenome]
MATEHAVGTRKRATAKIWLTPGVGKFTANGKGLEEYLKRKDLFLAAIRPLEVTDSLKRFDVR